MKTPAYHNYGVLKFQKCIGTLSCNAASVAVTHWKNLKALTVNPLEVNKSFRASSLTEELRSGDRKELPELFVNDTSGATHASQLH